MVKREIMLLALCVLFVAYMPFTNYHLKTSSQFDIISFILKPVYGQTSDPASPDPSMGDNSTDVSNSIDVSSGTDASQNATNQNDTFSEHDKTIPGASSDLGNPVDNQQSSNENNQNKTEGEQHSEYNYQSSNENNQNKTEGENQTQSNHEGIDEINNENNNEKATHQENQQDVTNIENAIENKTVAAEVNIGNGNEETKSIDSNIDMHTNSTSDSVSVTVDSKTESGPKVIIFNLNSTTIDVSNVKYLHVTYDGHSIAPATDVNAVLHPKSTDEPSYAIIVTQNGAKILVSIPHFSTHTITLSQINKVMPSAVPEFPITLLVMLVAVTLIVTFYRIKSVKI